MISTESKESLNENKKIQRMNHREWQSILQLIHKAQTKRDDTNRRTKKERKNMKELELPSKFIKVHGIYEDIITIQQGKIETTEIQLRTKSTEDTKRLMDILKKYGELAGVWLNFDIKLGYGDDYD